MQYEQVYNVLKSWISQWWDRRHQHIPLFFDIFPPQNSEQNFVMVSFLLDSTKTKTLSQPILYETSGLLQFQVFSYHGLQLVLTISDLLNQQITHQEIQISQNNNLSSLRFSTGNFRYLGKKEGLEQYYIAYPWTIQYTLTDF